MSRIRTIKPEFFTSESVLELSPLARIFFIGLWCEADREGRLKWKPKTLKIRYLPGDNVKIEKLCAELIKQEMIIVYVVDNLEYCEIPSFKNHQVINNRETKSIIPERSLGKIHACVTRESGVQGEGREGREGKGKEGKGRECAWALPEWLNVQAWNEFEQHRKSIKKTMSDLARTKAANQLEKLSHTEQQACIDKSIQSGWPGLYPEKINQGRGHIETDLSKQVYTEGMI